MKKSLYVVVLALGAFLMACLAAQPAHAEMKYGEWEYTVQMEMSGMPANMSIPPTVFKQCLKPGEEVPKNKQHDNTCKILDQSIKGNTVTWKIKCNDKGNVTEGSGTITYSGNTMSGTVDMTMKSGGQNMQIKQKMSGKRLGDCK